MKTHTRLPLVVVSSRDARNGGFQVGKQKLNFLVVLANAYAFIKNWALISRKADTELNICMKTFENIRFHCDVRRSGNFIRDIISF